MSIWRPRVVSLHIAPIIPIRQKPVRPFLSTERPCLKAFNEHDTVWGERIQPVHTQPCTQVCKNGYDVIKGDKMVNITHMPRETIDPQGEIGIKLLSIYSTTTYKKRWVWLPFVWIRPQLDPPGSHSGRILQLGYRLKPCSVGMGVLYFIHLVWYNLIQF